MPCDRKKGTASKVPEEADPKGCLRDADSGICTCQHSLSALLFEILFKEHTLIQTHTCFFLEPGPPPFLSSLPQLLVQAELIKQSLALFKNK